MNWLKELKWFKDYFLRGENLLVTIFLIGMNILFFTFAGSSLKGVPILFTIVLLLIINAGIFLMVGNAIKAWKKESGNRLINLMFPYLIPKGSHYSIHFLKLYLGSNKKFKIKVNFTESCRYDIGAVDQADINKLFGVSFGYHKWNSIRIGWEYDPHKRQIGIHYYYYENKVRKFTVLGHVAIGVEHELELELKDNSFYISIPDCRATVMYQYPKFRLGYYLYPYFGGNKAATKDTIIKMNVTKTN